MEFPQELYTVGGSGGAQFDQPVVRVHYASLTVPASVYDYDVRSRDLTLRKRQPVHGHDPSAYEEHRLWATAEDGARVPISVVCRAGARGPAGEEQPDPVPALRLRRVRDLRRPDLLGLTAVAARPRRRRRDRPRPRRRRDGPELVRRRTAASQAKHVLRLRGRGAQHLVDSGWTTRPTPARRGRLGRRPADRGGGQRARRPLRRPRGRGAVRRRPHLDARREPPADRHRVRRVGQPRGRRRRPTTTSPATRRTRTSAGSPTRRSWPRPRSTTPGSSTSSPRSGWPDCGPRPRTRPGARTSC